MTQRHKVFVSFHHANDERYKAHFIDKFSNLFDGFISKAVSDGDINPNSSVEATRQKIRDEYISDATVTIVLIGQETWKRKHVDWEISASIRDTKHNSRTGLIGILLPSYDNVYSNEQCENEGYYYPYTIPPRLYDNIECGFAKIYTWDDDPLTVQSWIHEAFLDKDCVIPDNSYPSFAKNRPASQTEWSY